MHRPWAIFALSISSYIYSSQVILSQVNVPDGWHWTLTIQRSLEDTYNSSNLYLSAAIPATLTVYRLATATQHGIIRNFVLRINQVSAQPAIVEALEDNQSITHWQNPYRTRPISPNFVPSISLTFSPYENPALKIAPRRIIPYRR